jgi:TPR repeat protein
MDTTGKNFRVPDAHLNILKQKALKGDVIAQCDLGYYYKIGFGVARDAGESAKWYLLGAREQNFENLKGLFGLLASIDRKDTKEISEIAKALGMESMPIIRLRSIMVLCGEATGYLADENTKKLINIMKLYPTRKFLPRPVVFMDFNICGA